MKAFTINDLLKECQKQVKLGNGGKTIMISDDDEGNGYHYLWYSFQSVKEYEKSMEEYGLNSDFYWSSDNVATKENTMILG